MLVRIDTETNRKDGPPHMVRLGRGTKIVDLDTGQSLGRAIRNVVVHIPADGIITADIEVIMVSMDAVAEARLFGSCPHCGKAVGLKAVGNIQDAEFVTHQNPRKP